MAAKSQNKSAYSVTCMCGSRMTLDIGAIGRPRVCRACGGIVTIAWSRDPKSGKTIPVVVKRKDAKGFPFLAICGCGYTRPISKEEARASPVCPGCGKTMAVEKGPEPKTLAKTRVPVKPPSKPLVPLYLRPPLRVAAKAGDKTFECPCGERLLIRADTEKRPLQCYKCGRFHIIEIGGGSAAAAVRADVVPGTKRRAPRGAEKAKEPAKAPEPPKPARPLGLGEVACACGNIIPPRTSRTGRDFTCSQCGRQGKVEDSVDPKTKELVLRAVFTGGQAKPAAAPTPPPESAPLPSSPSTSVVLSDWTCVCGLSIDSQQVLTEKEVECAGCGRIVALQSSRPAHSTTLRIRPVVTERRVKPAAGVATPPPAAAPTPAPKPPPRSGVTDIFNLVPQPPADDSPAQLPADAQIALCECGAELLISRDDVGIPIQCPACDMRMTVEEVPDQITGISTLRIRTIGKMEEDHWSLDDFH